MPDPTRRTVLRAIVGLVALHAVAACSEAGPGPGGNGGGRSGGGKRSTPSWRSRSLRPSAVRTWRRRLRTVCAALLVVAVTGCGAGVGRCARAADGAERTDSWMCGWTTAAPP
ncbi:hypothetical protein [Kitasatospora sp. NPDC059327]|uniref:hypothetical protein n=1 Tax=Kitasatospora sp. NPDC059327 TaxID=3346803 RepID=UPI00369BD184